MRLTQGRNTHKCETSQSSILLRLPQGRWHIHECMYSDACMLHFPVAHAQVHIKHHLSNTISTTVHHIKHNNIYPRSHQSVTSRLCFSFGECDSICRRVLQFYLQESAACVVANNAWEVYVVAMCVNKIVFVRSCCCSSFGQLMMYAAEAQV